MADDPSKDVSVETLRQLISERAVTADVAEPRVLAARIRTKRRGGKQSDSTTLIAADRRR